MEEYTISANVKIPARRRLAAEGHWSKYPIHLMEIGESFFVSDPAGKKAALRKVTHLYNLARRANKKILIRSVCENDVEGVRVWRIE